MLNYKDMTEDEIKIKELAEEFARLNKKRIAVELTDMSKYVPDETPVSVFMAGSPGAGKTEYSENFIELFEKDKERKVIRIDADELRAYLPGYTGSNSYLFQKAISGIVSHVHDLALEQKQTFLLDGTFSDYKRAAENVSRSLSRNRSIFIFYVYQKPEVAWKFTQARETIEGRNIPKDVFIQRFIDARNTVEDIRKNFDGRVVVFLVKKNFETHAVEDIIEITPDGRSIDDYLGQRYTREDLEKLL